jgi:hypothetical protein
MALDAANPLIEFADQDTVTEHRCMIVRHRLAQRDEPSSEIVELVVVPTDHLSQPAHRLPQTAHRLPQPTYRLPQPTHRLTQPSEVGGEVIELAVMPGHSAGDLRQQLVNRSNIRPVGAAHLINQSTIV